MIAGENFLCPGLNLSGPPLCLFDIMMLIRFFCVIFVEKIRKFGIVAHVDHGKSTLVDRLLIMTNVIKDGERDQFLDKLQVCLVSN